VDAQRWTVGEATITSVVEDETHHIPPEFFFPDVHADDIKRHAWLVPDFADEHGNIALRVQALIIEIGRRRVLVDPCVGNGKDRPLPFWNQQNWPFMERLADAGFKPDAIDSVVHTHLHADHVGWATHLVEGEWRPTFINARHLYTARELEYCRSDDNPGVAGVYADSVEPIIAAGLSDIVDEDADLGDGLTLEPSHGHTPGHVSLWIESHGEQALITGDFLHHPVQCQETHIAEVGDADPEEARQTRARMLTKAAAANALVIGTHFPTRPAGRLVKADGKTDGTAGNRYRFQPV
jgi:glyoxylase-like metal-dependent hydrolase (beta-lactamase superfamily II)